MLITNIKCNKHNFLSQACSMCVINFQLKKKENRRCELSTVKSILLPVLLVATYIKILSNKLFPFKNTLNIFINTTNHDSEKKHALQLLFNQLVRFRNFGLYSFIRVKFQPLLLYWNAGCVRFVCNIRISGVSAEYRGQLEEYKCKKIITSDTKISFIAINFAYSTNRC